MQADLDDQESLERAFEGSKIIFGVTDFWTIFQDPTSMAKKRPGQNITEYCFQVEFQQGKNLVNAAAAIKQLDLLVFSSMAMASKWSNKKFSRIYHMDSKALVADYAQSLPALENKFSQIQAPIYYNLFWQWGLPTTPKKVGTAFSYILRYRHDKAFRLTKAYSKLTDPIEFKVQARAMFQFQWVTYKTTLVNV